jgi:hypothetical protein
MFPSDVSIEHIFFRDGLVMWRIEKLSTPVAF